MKILKALLLSSTLVLSSSFAAEDASKTTSKLTSNSVVAEYNGTKVTLKNIQDQFQEMFGNQPGMVDKKLEDMDKAALENIVKGYIRSKLVEIESEKSNIQDSADYKQKLENLKSKLAQQVFVETMIKKSVTDKEIEAEYNKLKQEFTGKEEFKASHILVDDEKKAKELKASIAKGKKFEDIAKAESKDEGSKVNGGELGYFTKGQLVPEFETKIFTMKKGEISDPVKTQFGWHIIRLDDKRPMKVPTLDEIKPSIQARLARDVIEKYLADLESKANVKISL